MNKKDEKPMGTVAAVEETGFIDMREQLAPKRVKAYVESRVASGRAEYNNGTIHVRSKHPLDECLRRGIIEEQHHDSGKRIMTIRDCAFSATAGRIYNDIGEGDNGVDAMTLFINTERLMRRLGTLRQWGAPWDLVKLVCFSDADIDGDYFDEADYSMLYRHIVVRVEPGGETFAVHILSNADESDTVTASFGPYIS
jgi:hypothetical protein